MKSLAIGASNPSGNGNTNQCAATLIITGVALGSNDASHRNTHWWNMP